MSSSEVPLRTTRLVLRRVTPSDAPRMTALVSEWDVVRTTARIPHPYVIEDAHAHIARCSDKFARAIELNGDFVGMIGFDIRQDCDLEIGYWIGKPYWGHGYITESAHAMIEQAFDVEQANIIHAGYFTDNPASGRVLEKLGFEHTGQTTMNCTARDETVTAYRLALTRACWQARTTP